MIAFDDRAIHFADPLNALVRVCVITNNVPETNKVGALILARIHEHGLERFEIRVNITKNGKAHL